MSCSTEHLVLHTIDGAADLLVEELRAMRTIRSIRQTSVTTVECAVDGPLDELADCGLFSTAAADRGQVVAGIGQRLGRPERLPWSTNLIVAEVLVRLARFGPACREPRGSVVGTDHDSRALVIAARNGVRGALAGADALPLGAGTVDRVIANLPFGKQVGSHRANRTLYPAALDEIARVLAADGRAVLLTEDKRLLRAATDQQKALKVVRQRLLRYNGATPTAYVLGRPRRRVPLVQQTARSQVSPRSSASSEASWTAYS